MVDKYIEYSDLVETLQEAYGFIMDHADEFKAPNISIMAHEVYHDIQSLTGDDESDVEIHYNVSVAGNVN